MAPALALDGVHKLALRPYQEEVLAKSEAAEARGCRRQLWVLATGLGKTVCFVALAAKRGDRTLIIAHRDELIAQAAAKARQWWPDADIGIVKAERNEVHAQDIVVASVQSLSPARLARLGRFGLVVVDEAHHATSASYTRVLEALRAGEADGPLLVGVTATPTRADGKGLVQHFEEVVAEYPILWGIRNGYLVDIRAREVKLADLDLNSVRKVHGDYADGQLGQALSDANAPWHIVDAWKRYGEGRLTASFHPTIAGAQEQAAEFMAHGVRAACVSGVSLDERRRVLRALETGGLQVVTNAAVLTEGWDFPPLACIINGRPTRSVGMFTQILGRGLRPYPGKEDCLVLDVTDSSSRLDLCTVPSLFGVEKRKMVGLRPRTVTEALDEQEADEARRRVATPRAADGQVIAADVNLFKQYGGKAGRVAWGRTSRGAFATSAGKTSVIMEPLDEAKTAWRVYTVAEDGDRKLLLDGVPLDLAQGFADDHVRANAPDNLVNRLAKWRKNEPSEKQLALAAKLRVAVDPAWTRGDLSAAIDARFAEIRMQKAQRRAR